ncbi:MAG: MFS transporter [Alphaproteobacteria bacterium]|nr:MAG: MFS transporter [Alphaproteobacteria bacterium]
MNLSENNENPNSAQGDLLEENQETVDEGDILLARKVTLDMLGNVLDRRNSLDVTLDNSDAFAALPQRQRAFTRMLLTTTLRRLGQIDDLITFAQNRPDDLKTPAIRNILRLGVTQLFFMVVPDHASVDTSVRLAEEIGMERQKGFVNAILRKLSREGAQRIEGQDAGRLNTPQWLLKIWVDDYGLNGAAQIAEANMCEAPLDFTVKSIDDRPYWGNTLQASELSTGTLRRMSGGNIREMEGFDDGKWWIQDAAAAIPATLLGDITGQHVIDMCAAPGGKTLQLAAMGANVTAIDRSAKRLKRLEENLERMGLKDQVQIEISDAAAWKSVDAPQRILLDAPCSATGTIRRHPDTGYLKSPKDITGLMSIQERLLAHAGEMLDIGGILIYCTCSLQKDEGEYQIKKFLKKNLNFERIAIQPEEIGKYDELINEQGDLRILPYHLSAQGGMDGFFISRLTRTR